MNPVAAGLVLLALLAGCAREDAGSTGSAPAQPMPDQVISDFGLTETTGGTKDWSMEALKAYVYDKRNIVEADLVKITFFDEQGGVRSVLTAHSGRLNRTTSDMEAWGDVVVTGSGGVELRSQKLSWVSKTRQIVSDDSVTVIRSGDVLSGWGFRGDPDLGKFEILRDMKATIRGTADRGVGL
ncbi:MAG: LPS export ABC transporter periplasmic protein LptC [bacterium]